LGVRHRDRESGIQVLDWLRHYDEYPDGFLCFIVPDKPFAWRRFRRIDTRERVHVIAGALETVLRKHSGVRDLRWWPEWARDRRKEIALRIGEVWKPKDFHLPNDVKGPDAGG
jgi:hypothetical protein